MNADTPLRLDVADGSGSEFGDCTELSLKPLFPHSHPIYCLPRLLATSTGFTYTSGKFNRIGNVSNTNTVMISAFIGLDKAWRHEPNIVMAVVSRETLLERCSEDPQVRSQSVLGLKMGRAP